MDTQQKYEIMASRYNSFSKTDKQFFHRRFYYYDTLLVESIIDNKPLPDRVINQAWEFSTIGYVYSKNLAKAKLLFEDEIEMMKVFRLMISRKKWYHHDIDKLLVLKEEQALTPVIGAIWINQLSKEFKNALDSYMHDPIFKVGQMVQMRSNIGVDAIIRRHTYKQGNAPHWQSVGNTALAKLKEKTYMIIEVDPKTEGRIWAKSYSYKEKQGGGRYYKVLPLGDTKTYYVVEKFMKKCRTKAVKDAKR